MSLLKTPCVILCGGKSSRMKEDAGIDKAFLDFDGKPLYLRQYEKLSAIFENIYLNVKNKEGYEGVLESRIIEDVKKVEGRDLAGLFAPTVGMYSAFCVLKAKKIFFIAVDAPFLSKNSIEKLVSKDGAAIATHKGKTHPTVGAYEIEAQKEFLWAIKEDKHKLTLLLEKIGTIFVEIEDGAELANLNRYEDYERAINNATNPFGREQST